MQAYVRGSRALARRTARTLIPANQAQVWAHEHGTRLISRLPARVTRALARLRMADSIAIKDYAWM